MCLCVCLGNVCLGNAVRLFSRQRVAFVCDVLCDQLIDVDCDADADADADSDAAAPAALAVSVGERVSVRACQAEWERSNCSCSSPALFA